MKQRVLLFFGIVVIILSGVVPQYLINKSWGEHSAKMEIMRQEHNKLMSIDRAAHDIEMQRILDNHNAKMREIWENNQREQSKILNGIQNPKR
jgi:hypothetical protein